MSALPDGAGPVSGIGRSTRGTDVLKSVTANALVSESVEITLRTVDVKQVWTLSGASDLRLRRRTAREEPGLFADLDIDTSTPAGEMAQHHVQKLYLQTELFHVRGTRRISNPLSLTDFSDQRRRRLSQSMSTTVCLKWMSFLQHGLFRRHRAFEGTYTTAEVEGGPDTLSSIG